MTLAVPAPLLSPRALVAGLLLLSLLGAPAARASSDAVKLLESIDEQSNPGDLTVLILLKQERGKLPTQVREFVVYSRDEGQKFILLLTKPKIEAGVGFLRLDRNLWSYDPTVGLWERRTERDQIAGTNFRRSDLDISRMSAEYDPTLEGEEMLGPIKAKVLRLKVKPGVDVAFPVMKIWVDDGGKVVKREDYALSGKLLRTHYIPKWQKVRSVTKDRDIWLPKEVHVYDETLKGFVGHLLFQGVDTRPVDANVFTKAWLESKSR